MQVLLEPSTGELRVNEKLPFLLFAEPSHQHGFQGLDRVEILLEVPFHEDFFIVIGWNKVEYASGVTICTILSTT